MRHFEADIFHLAEPKRKGLLPLLFSRFLIIALLILVQLAVPLVFYGWLCEYVPYLNVFQALFTLCMVIYLFNCEMDSSARLTWMFLIAVVPLLGAVLLLFTQANLGHRKLQVLTAQRIAESRALLGQDPQVSEALAHDGSGVDDLSRYLCRSGCFPVFDGTEVRFFPSGEEKFAAMLEELKKAEKFIFLEYFIIEEGYMWGEILRILIEKAKAGVDVRVMYDGMCEVSKLPSDYPKRLREQGIKAKAFAPIAPMVSSHYNYRDHRKILVIDGKVAFNGGVNLADEYINRSSPFGHWKDTAVMLRGRAAQSFTLMFLQMWNIDEKAPDFAPAAIPAERAEAAGYVMPYGDCPLDREKVGEMVYMDILNRATDYVHIMTPYLILDGELETALRFAAERGVDVRLIIPGVPDKKLAWALAKSHYRSLLASGVKIYEYTPGFVHAKVFVSDDRKAVVGTINLDYRSLYHHFECATYLYRTSCVAEIEADFAATRERCQEITHDDWKTNPLMTRIVATLLRLFAPLL